MLFILFWISSHLFLQFSVFLEDIVHILTTEAPSEILYPNYHGCKMLKILAGYVDFHVRHTVMPSHDNPMHSLPKSGILNNVLCKIISTVEMPLTGCHGVSVFYS